MLRNMVLVVWEKEVGEDKEEVEETTRERSRGTAAANPRLVPHPPPPATSPQS